MSGIQVHSGWNITNPPTPVFGEGQTAFKVQQMGSSRAEKVSLCAPTSVLPKPPPIPRLCPHSQSKIISLYYRLQTGPVNILPLGCTQSSGMHLNERSFLRVSTQLCAPGPPRSHENLPPACQKWGADQEGGDVRSCGRFFLNELAAWCRCTATLLP